MAFTSAFAVICERALVERDGVVSCVRLVDIFQVHAGTPILANGDFPPIPMTLFVSVWLTDDDDEIHKVAFKLVRPDRSETGDTLVEQKAEPGRVEGFRRALHIGALIGVTPSQHGVHEFQIFVDGKHVTSSEFFIARSDAPGGSQAQN